MHILIYGKSGRVFIRKKVDIQNVYSNMKNETVVSFNKTKLGPIIVKGSVEDFFKNNLSK